MNNATSIYIRIQFILLLSCFFALAQTPTDKPPVLTATGNQVYCPGTALNVVTDFNITDPDATPTNINAIYVQISSGYVNGQDRLSLNTTITDIVSSFDVTAGKLTIRSQTNSPAVPYTTLVQAVKSVVYTNNGTNPSGTRTFSITIGDANYLASTQHYYRYVAQNGISWTAARAAAEQLNYYGLKGYLATLLSADEAKLCGEQASGNGWIGGSDAENEGVWKWVTGPEAGTVFWNGGANGSSPNYSNWNTNEPNNTGGNEHYAHVTAPGIGRGGSWNDLSVGGDPTGDYQARGYIVEFGSPSEAAPQISATTTATLPRITGFTNGTICGSGSVNLQAIADSGIVYWFADATSSTPIYIDNNKSGYTTPVLKETTNYYASANDGSCTTATRTLVKATINAIPVVTVPKSTVPVCSGSSGILEATASVGTITWFAQATGGTALGTGNSFTTHEIFDETTFYAEAVNNGCFSANRVAVTVTVLQLPDAGEDVEVKFCEDTNQTLDAGVTDVAYKWSSGETTKLITVTKAGTYTVTLSNAAGCSATKTFTAITIAGPDIKTVNVKNESATIVLSNTDPENFEYSLDGITYQASPVFYGLGSGVYTAYAKSVQDCGTDFRQFTVDLIPKVFTPNGDGANDVFTLAGMGKLPQATITIFDRYGMLITELSNQNPSWDGTLNGRPLPATDYWCIVKLDAASPEIKGHFALMR